jgi:hypothetical protein
MVGRHVRDVGWKHHLLRLGWDGSVRWKKPVEAHHDVEWAPGGTILTLDRSLRMDHQWSEQVSLRDNSLVRLSAEGEILETISLYEVLRDNDVGFQFLLKSGKKTGHIHLLHGNSVETVRDSEWVDRHPLYRQGNVLISLRSQNSVVVIDPRTRELIWAWGQGAL